MRLRPDTLDTVGDGEVHVWVATPSEVMTDGRAELCLGLLDAAERRRHGRFRFARDRDAFLVAHALVRTTLSRYEAVAPTEWRFSTNDHGRPDISPVHGSSLRFNLSHTEDLVACAVVREREIGVDVEAGDRRVEVLEIADRYLAPSELAQLRALDPSRHRDRFFTYWTLKEAYIKARGLGLALPLEQIAFDVVDPERIRVELDSRLGDDATSWQLLHRTHGARHHLAVCVRRGSSPELAISVEQGL